MATEIISDIFTVVEWLINKFKDYREDQKEAKRLNSRIEALEPPLREIQKLNSDQTNLITLNNVLQTVKEIKTYIESYEKRSRIRRFLCSSKKKFVKFNQRLDSYIGDLELDLTFLTTQEVRNLVTNFNQMQNNQNINNQQIQGALKNLNQQMENLGKKFDNSQPLAFQYQKSNENIEENIHENIEENTQTKSLKEDTNLGFIQKKFGIESKSATIICKIFKLEPEERMQASRIMTQMLTFLTSDCEKQMEYLFHYFDKKQTNFVSQSELKEGIDDYYFLITLLAFRDLIDESLEEYLNNLNEQAKKNFYDEMNRIKEILMKSLNSLPSQNESNSKIKKILDSHNLENFQIDLEEWKSYCEDKNNLVIEFLTLLKTLLNEKVKTKFILPTQFESKNQHAEILENENNQEKLAQNQFEEAQNLFNNNQFEEAEQLLQKAFENTIKMDLEKKILLLLKEIYSKDPFDEKDILTKIYLADIYLQGKKEDRQEARKLLFELHHNFAPEYAPFYLQVYSQLIFFDEILGNHQGIPVWYLQKGICYQQMSNNSKAIESFKKAVEKKPDYIQALNQLSPLYLSQNEYTKASQISIQIGEYFFKNGIFIEYKTAFDQAFSFLQQHSQDISEIDFTILKKEYDTQENNFKQVLQRIKEMIDSQSNINQENENQNQIQNQNETENETETEIEFFNPFSNSEIITEEYARKLKEWINDNEFFTKMKKGFSTQTDGFHPKKWLEAVDKKGRTLIIIKTTDNYIFGGFTSVGFREFLFRPKYRYDATAFIFSLRNGEGDRNPGKFPIKKGQEKYAILSNSEWGPIFGCADYNFVADIELFKDLKSGKSNFGMSYQLPEGITYGTDEARNYLAGSPDKWKVEKVEIYFI